jgi:hypothetical protein
MSIHVPNLGSAGIAGLVDAGVDGWVSQFQATPKMMHSTSFWALLVAKQRSGRYPNT